MDTVLKTDAFTGLSVGVFVRDAEFQPDPADPQDRVYAFKECELAEISVTPLPAVPGTEVLNVRRTPEERVHGQVVALRMLLTTIPRKELIAVCHEFGLDEIADAKVQPDANGRTPSDTEIRKAASVVTGVPFAERVAWLRTQMGRLHDRSFGG
jgi:prohead serine protease